MKRRNFLKGIGKSIAGVSAAIVAPQVIAKTNAPKDVADITLDLRNAGIYISKDITEEGLRLMARSLIKIEGARVRIQTKNKEAGDRLDKMIYDSSSKLGKLKIRARELLGLKYHDAQ